MAKLPAYQKYHHPKEPGTYLMLPQLMGNFDSAVRYEAKPGDLFICSYFKCGITWLQNIVWRMTHNGEFFTKRMRDHIAFLEFDGGEKVESTRDSGQYHPIKTHFPYKWIPKHEKAKYIFITREPKDVCVSAYYHMKGFPVYEWEHGSFDDLVEGFVKGRLESCDYFEVLNEWYGLRDDPSILFLLYEDLLTRNKETIMKIARFLDPKYVGDLTKDNFSLLEKIAEETSFKIMRQESDSKWVGQEKRDRFIRKGVMGDWKNHMTPSQANAIDARLAEASQGNGSDRLWT